jgi:hypothetical protein
MFEDLAYMLRDITDSVILVAFVVAIMPILLVLSAVGFIAKTIWLVFLVLFYIPFKPIWDLLAKVQERNRRKQIARALQIKLSRLGKVNARSLSPAESGTSANDASLSLSLSA